jgi:hypothetical protein
MLVIHARKGTDAAKCAGPDRDEWREYKFRSAILWRADLHQVARPTRFESVTVAFGRQGFSKGEAASKNQAVQ